MKRDSDSALYLHCEECEWVWHDPELVSQVNAGCLGIDYEGEYADTSEIETAGWTRYATEQDDDP